MELNLQQLSKHPELIQELIEQNELMSESMPEFSQQTLSLKKKLFAKGTGLMAEIENSAPPYVIPNRLLFQEGVHNGLSYSYKDIKNNFGQWENLSMFFAEHEDGAPAWVGVTKNVRLNEDEKAIYGDIETPNKTFALTLAYQVQNKNGKMGISPTLDVNKELSQGKFVANSPWTLQSQSIVLDPAVRTTVFNSKKQGGEGSMANETQQLKENEVAIAKEDLETLKTQSKELQDFKKQQLSKEVEELAAVELALGRVTKEKLEARKLELERLTEPERKVLASAYGWMGEQLSEKDTNDLWLQHLESAPEDLKAEFKDYIDGMKKKKAMMSGSTEAGKEAEPERKNLSKENLSMSRETMTPKKGFNRFQELSEKNKEDNQNMIDFLKVNQGDRPIGRK